MPRGSCRDQRVIAGRRPDLDLDVNALAAPDALALELRLMAPVGDGQPAGEAATVPTRQLTGVEHDRGHLGLRGADLDPSAGEHGVDRVVVAIDRTNGCCGTRATNRRSLSGIVA